MKQEADDEEAPASSGAGEKEDSRRSITLPCPISVALSPFLYNPRNMFIDYFANAQTFGAPQRVLKMRDSFIPVFEWQARLLVGHFLVPAEGSRI